MYSLTLAITLGFKTIFLLGADGKEINGKTHFYQGLIDPKDKRWHGVGKKQTGYKTSTYNDPDKINNRWYAPFQDLEGITIYNVSPESAIDVFLKIDYTTFYKQVHPGSVNQDEVRDKIKSYILDKIK